MAQAQYGGWRYNGEHAAMLLTTTGQRVRYIVRADRDDTLGLTESRNRYWMRFEYEDRDVRYPLLVEWRSVPSKDAKRPLVWRVDHVRSAELWQREASLTSSPPSY